MSTLKLNARDIIERFNILKQAAKRSGELPGNMSAELDLHDAAMAYSRAVRLVMKKDRR